VTDEATAVSAGGGVVYDWANDQVSVKVAAAATDGRVTVVEDRLKPGFDLARHRHRVMTEIFYVLEGEVIFEYDDGSITATPGMTVVIPPRVWHRATCAAGGRLITVFTPGGFDAYMVALAALTPSQMGDATLMTELSQRYDIWDD
jgi:quercetin dioxygenase-like cupin family protein